MKKNICKKGALLRCLVCQLVDLDLDLQSERLLLWPVVDTGRYGPPFHTGCRQAERVCLACFQRWKETGICFDSINNWMNMIVIV